jgi:subtilisin family serine protease
VSDALRAVGLLPLMERTAGRPEVRIGLVDGPVHLDHPDLERERIAALSGGAAGASCTRADSVACRHGTFVAGILSAARTSRTPGLCPGCTLLVRPIFPDTRAGGDGSPSATEAELARALLECVEAGAHVVNVSAAVAGSGVSGERALKQSLDRAAARGVIVVAAAGNHGTIGGSPLTSHPWVVPVAACDRFGRPAAYSNLGPSIGRRGLSAPGDGITSLASSGASIALSGTSAAAPLVTGAIALLWSEHPRASASRVRRAATLAGGPRRPSVVPPLLNAWASHQALGG